MKSVPSWRTILTLLRTRRHKENLISSVYSKFLYHAMSFNFNGAKFSNMSLGNRWVNA
jgi:hypothetical protein